MKEVWNALLYSTLGIAVFLLGLVDLFLPTLTIGLILFGMGIFWIVKAKKGQGNLGTW